MDKNEDVKRKILARFIRVIDEFEELTQDERYRWTSITLKIIEQGAHEYD